MALYKCIYACRADVQGWQEQYIFSNDVSLEDMRSKFLVTLPSRRQMFGSGAGVSHVMVRPFPSGLFLSRDANVLRSPPLDKAIIRDTTWNAVALRVTANDGRRRTIWIRGVEDNDIRLQANGAPNLSARFQGFFPPWWQSMRDNGVRLYGLLPRAAQASVNVTGLFVVAGVPNLVEVGVDVALAGVGVNDLVLINGVRGINLRQLPPGNRGVNGVWRVLAITGLRYRIGLDSDTLPNPPVWTSGGKMYTRTMGAVAPAPIPPVFIKFSRKKSGRPLFVSPGRAGARRAIV